MILGNLEIQRCRHYQPVFHFAEAVVALRQNRFDPSSLELIAQRPDEMGKLARAFLEMLVRIRARRKDLEQRKIELRKKLGESQ